MLWEVDYLFAIVGLLGVELGQVLCSLGRAGEIVVVSTIEVFVVSVNPMRKRKDRRQTAVEVSVELGHNGRDEECQVVERDKEHDRSDSVTDCA